LSIVTLRRARLENAPSIHVWRAQPSTATFQPIIVQTLPEVASMIVERAKTPVAPDAAGDFLWVIEADGQSVGWISLYISASDRRHAKGTIGYTLGETFRGRGYGAAGLAALLPIAFDRDQLDLERLEAVAAVENVASRRVLEGNGFHLEGILRGLLIIKGVRVDHATYGLLRIDWEQQ
jgi:RimJ/RimL family protein N-acetyltransferase